MDSNVEIKTNASNFDINAAANSNSVKDSSMSEKKSDTAAEHDDEDVVGESDIPTEEHILPALEVPAGNVIPPQNFEEVETDEIFQKKVELKLFLKSYFRNPRFGPYLKELKYSEKKIENMSYEQLQRYRKDIQFVVANKNTNRTIQEAIPHFLAGYEKGVYEISQHKVDIGGTAAALNGSEEFKDVVEELILENQGLVYQTPARRLIFMILTTSAKMAMINKFGKKVDLTQPINPSILSQYSDILNKKT
jgi:hypothetical protein